MAAEENGGASVEDGVLVKNNGKTRTGVLRCSVLQILITIIFVLFLVAIACALTYYLTQWRCSTSTRTSVVVPTIKATVPTTDSPDVNATASYETTESSYWLDDQLPWEGRLPLSVVPINYDVIITPYLYQEDAPPGRDNFTFDGSVSITVLCKESTSQIRLHVQDMNISAMSVLVPGNYNAGNLTAEYSMDERHQFLVIDLEEDLVVDSEYVINIDYEGLIVEDLEGFYRISYKDEVGEMRWGGVTQLQPTSARRVLPCFDEPAFKATFDVTIRHRPDMTALSNGIELTITDLNVNVTTWKETVFKTTPIMSSYLLAIAVTHFESMTKPTASGALVRVWSKPQDIMYAQYSLDTAVNQTTVFESYLGSPYTLEKIDMIAVPRMIALAMENWGLIVYNEHVMIYNPAKDPLSILEELVMTVSHELAHQWFGNLVTPVWWDDIWLNEGLASYMEYVAADVSEPGWNMLKTGEMFYKSDFTLAFDSDSDSWSSPVIQNGETPDEVYELFNDIVYSKGAVIIRMLVYIIGEDVFLTGIRNYLNKHAYDNVVTDDFWKALTEADANHGGHDIKSIMDSWTLQAGYPLVTFDRINDTAISVSQEIFLVDNATNSYKEFVNDSRIEQRDGDLRQTWQVLISHTHESEMNFESPKRDWIHGENTANFALSSGVQPTDWYLVNIGRNCYYRVNYDATNWNRLSQQLQEDHQAIPLLNRFQLLDDAVALFTLELLDVDLLLNLTLYLHQELDHLPWTYSLLITDDLRIVMKLQSSFGLYQKYWRQKLAPVYNYLHWDNGTNSAHDNPIKQSHREQIVEAACYFQEENCLRTAKELYAQYMKDPTNNPIPQRSGLRRFMYCFAIQQGGEQEWEFAAAQGKVAPKGEGEDWLYGMACSTKPWLLNRLLQDVYDEKYKDVELAFNHVVQHISSHDIGLPIAWDYVQVHWDEMWDNYYEIDIYLSLLISDIASWMYTEVHLQQLKEFPKHHELSTYIEDVHRWAIEQVGDNISKRKEYGDEVSLWISQQGL